MYNYMGQKGSAAMLVIKRSAGVTLEMILRNQLHAEDEAHKCRNNFGFETDIKSKTGVSVATGPTKRNCVIKKCEQVCV